MNLDEIRTFRNHPTVILSQTVASGVILSLIMYFTLIDSLKDFREALILIGVMVAVIASISYVYWKKTLYVFTDTEINVTRDMLLSKSDKHIQYSRLASVTVRRDIFNRIFGTSTLMFNVNSSVNATSAEATLTLKRVSADILRDRLNALVFSKDMPLSDETEVHTMIQVTNTDVILHSILGQSTGQQMFGLLMFIYAVVTLFTNNGGGFVTAVLLMAISTVIPFISSLLKYYNYRVFRIGDTVTVESGLFSTTRRSFKVNKINSVRMRSPLIARLLGKTILEAEVVGMGDQDDGRSPVLCPLKRTSEVECLFRNLVPELYFESEPVHQSRAALMPMLVSNTVLAAIIAVVLIALFMTDAITSGMTDTWSLIVRSTELFAAFAIALLLYARVGMAQRHRSFDMGEDSFLFVHGAYDISREYISYDKVQYVTVQGGPLERMSGVASCSVYLMSSSGFRGVESGLFPPEELERISAEVDARISDGRYDYRRYL